MRHDPTRVGDVVVFSSPGRHLVCEGERRAGGIGSNGKIRDTVEG